MRFDIVTIFPAMIEHALTVGVVGRAIDQGALQVRVRDLRDFTTDRHHVVDDVPYGGGPGMVLKPEPLLRAVDAVAEESFSRGLLDFPQYTRPAAIGDVGGAMAVPEVLLSGNHGEIRRWRKRAALVRTLDRRPDLLATAVLDDEEREILRGLLAE